MLTTRGTEPLRTKRLFNWHSVIKAIEKALMGNIELSRPISDGLRNALVSNKAIPARVAVLLCDGSPSTVIRRIRAIVVNAVNGMFGRRPRTNVGIEVLEGAEPTVTHDNAATAIVGITGMSNVVTSLFDAVPGVALWSASHAVCSVHGGLGIPLQASAALGMSTFHASALNNNMFATVAEAIPPGVMLGPVGEGKHQKPVKPLSSVVFHSLILSQMCWIGKSVYQAGI